MNTDNVAIAVARHTAAGGELTIKALYEVIKTIPRSQRKQWPCARRAARNLVHQALAQHDKHERRASRLSDDVLWQRWRDELRQLAIAKLTPDLRPQVPHRASRLRCVVQVGKRADLQVDDDLYSWSAEVVSPHGHHVLVSHDAHDVTYTITVPYGWKRRVLLEGPGPTVVGRPRRTNNQNMTVLDAHPTQPVYGHQAWDVQVIARGRGVDAELVSGIVVRGTYYVDRRAAMKDLASIGEIDSETTSQRKRRLRVEADDVVREAILKSRVNSLPDTRAIGGALERKIANLTPPKAAALARLVTLTQPVLRRHARRGLRRIWQARESYRQRQRQRDLSSIRWHEDFLKIAQKVPDRTKTEREETAQAVEERKAIVMENRLQDR